MTGSPAISLLCQGIKERGAMVIVPSSVVETMGLGAVTGLTSLASTVEIPKE
ncbi:MAG TPA: hypothetical protein VN374_05000 [Desulfitobacteriaceae bacterium]|nr:hypothetical protein [Desulfitobacteriaceae bacterium]